MTNQIMINKDDFTLSVIIPCFNELNTIRAIVDRVRSADVKKMEIIIVDDCSVDGTRALLESQIAPLVSRIVYHDKNQGKGAALRTGFAHATGDIVADPGRRPGIRPQGISAPDRADPQPWRRRRLRLAVRRAARPIGSSISGT